MTFELPVTEQRVKPHQVTALHLLCAMAFLGTGALFYWMYLPYKFASVALVVAAVVLMVTAIVKSRWIQRKNVNMTFRIAELLILIPLGIFTAVHRWNVPTTMFALLALAVAFALYWENLAVNAMVIRISDAGIQLPVTSRKRSISWTEVEKVIFRHGTLTIDCHNQRLFQWMIGPVDIDAQQLEDYSSRQVEAHRSKRPANDW